MQAADGRDFIGCFLPFGALDKVNHPVEKAFAGIGRDANDQSVGEDARAAGDATAVAGAFANHRGAFARDGTFIDRCDPADHLAVAWNLIAGSELTLKKPPPLVPSCLMAICEAPVRRESSAR
jgi:hypothetical protein